MAEEKKHDFTAMEADLKRMLNMTASENSVLHRNKDNTVKSQSEQSHEQEKKEKASSPKAVKSDEQTQQDKLFINKSEERKKEHNVEKHQSYKQGKKDNTLRNKDGAAIKERVATNQSGRLNRQENKEKILEKQTTGTVVTVQDLESLNTNWAIKTNQPNREPGSGPEVGIPNVSTTPLVSGHEKRSTKTVVTKEDFENLSKKRSGKVKPPVQQDKESASRSTSATSSAQAAATDFLLPGDGKKKKRKKPKKKKAKSEFLEKKKITNENISDSDDSDEDAVENMPDPEKPMYDIDLIRKKYLDSTLTPAVLTELEKERIFPLKKKSTKFPKAMYFCRLCDYHCDSVALSRQHCQDARHRRRNEIRQQDQMLKNLPHPSPRHLQALDGLVDEIFSTHGLSSEDLVHRHKVALDIQEFIMQHIPDLRVQVYGSSLTGFGLKDSSLDLDLVYPEGANPAHCLARVYKLLANSEEFTNVKSSFSEKVPAVLFTTPCKTLHCHLTVGSRSAYLTSRYLTIYRELDERCRQLAVVFKYWAKVCMLDKQEEGTLPAYCYSLMTVFFLQHCQPPVLPILWKDLSEQSLRRPKTSQDEEQMLSELKHQSWVSENNQSTGELWREMIIFYGLHFDLNEKVICIRSKDVLQRAEKRWKSRRIAIEDPFSPKRNAGRSMHHTRLFDYFYNCLRKACLYFSLPTSHQNMSTYFKDKRHTSHHQKNMERKADIELEMKKGSGGILQPTPKQLGGKESRKENVPARDKAKLDYEHDSEAGNEEREKGNDSSDDVGEDNKEELDIEDLAEDTPNPRLTSLNCDSIENLQQLTPNCNDYKEVENETVNTLSTRDGTDGNKKAFDTTENSSDSGIAENQFFLACKQGLVKNVSDLESSFSENEKAECVASGMTENVFEVTGAMGGLKLSDNRKVEDDSGISAEKEITNLGNKKSDTPIAKINHYESNKTHDSVIKTTTKLSENSGNKETEKTYKAKEVECKTKGLQESSCDSDSDSLTDNSDSSPKHEQHKRVSSPVGAAYNYQFALNTLTDGKGPSILCPLCDKEGHHKASCPEDQLPKVIAIDPPTRAHLRILTGVVQQCMRDFSLTPDEIFDREAVRRNLEIYIQELFPEAELQLFGSSMNGFGFHQSDLDICVTFHGKKPEDLNFVEHIEAICKKLKTHKGLYGVFPITTAKVPIVKFKHRRSQLEGDISLYNILAIQNTSLLCTYARMDPRVQMLGYAIKVFAKVCDIGDASRGSLSSYAYMLMMIHYLQHTKPPVIPVLQELRLPGNPNPEFMVEGWNAWFFDDLKKLHSVWPDFDKNTDTVGALWEGFFRYFLEEFNFDDQVVTIRQFERLTKFEKLWNGKCLAIEDPFDLNHNLGGGLSRKMNHYIMSTLVRARELYCISVIDDSEPVLKSDMMYYQDYFFDKQKLVTGDPPSDRLCRVCSKIGHIAKECPRIIARKEREAYERQRREEERERSSNQHSSPEKQNQNRQGTSRSMSDPGDMSAPHSPYRDKGQGQMGGQGQPRGQHPHSHSQSPDKRGLSPRLNINKAEKYFQDGGPPLSPLAGNQNLRGFNQSKQGSQGQGYGPNDPYLMGNQNANSSIRRNPPSQYRNESYGAYGGGQVNLNHSHYNQHYHGNTVYVNQSRQHAQQGGYNNQNQPLSSGHHQGSAYVPSSPLGYHHGGHGNQAASSPGNRHGNQFYEGAPQGYRSDRQINYPKKKGKKKGQAVDM
ncbi:hypothetical protein DPMN_084659, partial [Dreissena polymorpha]